MDDDRPIRRVSPLRRFLLEAPWWQLIFVTGVPFGAWMWLVNAWSQDPDYSWVTAVISAVLFGGFMGPLLARQNRRMRSAAGEVSADQVLLAERAARRGQVPTDPGLRETAHRLAVHQLAQIRSKRVFSTVVFALLIVASIYAAVAISPWYGLLVAFWVGMSAYMVRIAARLRRSAELLDPGAG